MHTVHPPPPPPPPPQKKNNDNGYAKFWGGGAVNKVRYGLRENGELLVFIVTQFKIDQNKNQNRSIDKVNQSINQSTLFKQGTWLSKLVFRHAV